MSGFCNGWLPRRDKKAFDLNHATGSEIQTEKAPATASADRKFWWLAVKLLLVVAVVGAYGLMRWYGPWSAARAPLTADLHVVVRSPQSASESKLITDPGAVPVHSGDMMSLQVNLNQPAYVCLIWIDASGKVIPLYPWNHDEIEVTDVGEQPPARKAAKILFSPPLGVTWKFGDAAGTETILLLARKEPLPQGLKLASIVGPTNSLMLEDGLEIVRVQDGVIKPVEMHGRIATTPADASSTKKMLTELGKQFEYVQAVSFAHVDE